MTTPSASRVQSPTRILAELIRLRGKVERAALYRELGREEITWCCHVADALELLIAAGMAVLPPDRDPRPSRRQRKRRTNSEGATL
jgi:hypothetical protein